MHGIYELKEKVIKELEEYGLKGDFRESELPTIDMLSHTAKNLCKLIEMCEDATGYSYGGRVNVRSTYSYADGRHGNDSYGMYPMYNDGSMARGRNANRDNMGRYSSYGNDEMIDVLHELKAKATNDRMRQEFDEFISRMERMH
jgi:hypothetical protein